MDTTNNKVISIGLFGSLNSGKCSLSVQLAIKFGNIATPKEFKYNNKAYKIFPIPCTKPDYKEHFEISVLNCEIAIVLIDTSKLENNIHNKEIQEYYTELLMMFYVHNIEMVIFCFNKEDLCDKDKNITEYKEQFMQSINDINSKMKDLFTSTQIRIEYVHNLNAQEGTNLPQLVQVIDSYVHLNKNNDNTNSQFQIFDSYIDNEEGFMVVSGKILNGVISLNDKLKLCGYNNSPIFTPEKICNNKGMYISTIYPKEFSTLKIKKDLFDSANLTTLNKSYLITSESLSVPLFTTFEADIMLTKVPCAVIAKGFYFILSSYSFHVECQIESIQGKYEGDKIVKKPCISCEPFYKAKVILTIKEPITRNKYEFDQTLGCFIMQKGDITFGCGKINKYKKYVP